MYSKLVDDIRSINDLETVINYYYPKQLKNKIMKCPFHNDQTPSLSIVDNGNGAFYKCFGCLAGGDIIDFVKRVEKVEFVQALEKAYAILNKPLDLPKSTRAKVNRIDTNNLNEYYEEKVKNAIKEKDLDKALKYELEKEKETEKTYYIKFPYIDSNQKPQKLWENLDEILKENNVNINYNEIIKDIEISGVEGRNRESQLVSIQSLAIKYGLNIPINTVVLFANKIADNNPINPVTNFLNYCYETCDKEEKYIDMLCDSIITTNDFDAELKKTLIRKWLLNTACIPFNEGNTNTEGVLTLQGKQGVGKTRFIREIIPMYVKTGLDLDPSDKDKVYQCIKYWVCELGELDSTFKKDLAKLKAFITEQTDEFRKPYGLVPIKYPRKTSFYATVNNEEFLKDETGNRRYWVIPVEKIDFDLIKKIDIYQLWGEVMHIRENNTETTYLKQNEIEMLNRSNKNFKVLDYLDLTVMRELDWKMSSDRWTWKPSAEIADRLYLKSTKGLRATLENYGAVYQKKQNTRGYFTPPFKTII